MASPDEYAAVLRRVAPHIDLRALRSLPAYVTTDEAAALVTKLLFTVAPRTVRTWDLPARLVNSRRSYPTVAVLADAARRIEASGSRRGINISGDRRATAGARASAEAKSADAVAAAPPPKN